MDVMDYTQNQTEELNNVNQTVTQPEQSKIKKPVNIDGYARKDGENIFEYIDRVGQDQIDLYNANVDRYAVKLRPEEYADINDLINVSSDPADKDAERYRIAAAMKYSKLYDITLDEAYKNLDAFNSSIFGNEPVSYNKSFWNTLVDSLTMGQNTVDMGMIGGQIREATASGDTEKAARLTDLYRKYQAQNELLQKNLPTNVAMKIVEAGAQSFPFTVGAIGMSVISPVTGFTYSAGVMAGGEYMDLIDSGASHETASAVSTIVGGINGIVEIELGNVAGALGARASGTKAGELLRKNVIEKVTKNVADKMHKTGGWRVVAGVLSRNLMENLEEGAEEAVQETFSLLGKHIANELDDLGIEGMTAKEITQDLAENFMGGVYGSILLGSGTLVKNSIAAKADYDAVKKAATIIPSEKSFTKAVMNSPVFEEMDEQTKEETAHEIYQKFGSKRDEELTRKADSLSEVISADEGMENYQPETDENGNELEAPEVPAETRDENGRLYSQQDSLQENEDGTYSGRKVYGDATKKENNLYGYINYTIDEEAGTVTIDDFKTNEYRQYLNNEMFADFADEMSDYDIQWNPSLEDAKKWKADIEALNPRGKENGLNYFSTKNQTEIEKKDQQTRQRLVRELSQKFNLSGEEKALTVAMVEAMAKSQGESVSSWVENNFLESGIMGNIEDLQEAARQESIKQGKEITATGGMTLKETAKGVKAIIYAAEGADLSTALHEFSHVWTMGLSGDLLSEAADVFGATQNKDGTYDWNAPVTLANGKTVSAYENLAYSYEKWLETGKAPTPQHENIFKKFAEFMKNCVKTLRSAVKLTPETEDFFNKYFNVSEGMLRNAENAVIEETANNVASENITKSGENLTENDEALSDEEIEALVSDFTNKELQTLVDAGLVSEETANSIKETKLDPITQTAVASILDDPEITVEKKASAVMKANSEAFEEKQANIEYYKSREDLTAEQKEQAIKDLENNNDINENGTGFPWSLVNKTPKDMLFQIIGEKGAEALDTANEETIRMDNRSIAEEMEAAGKDAKTIRFATGWERGADRQWKYEIEDIELKGYAHIYNKMLSGNGRRVIALSDLISGQVLKAYPDLKHILVAFEDQGTALGKYQSKGDFGEVIYLSPALYEDISEDNVEIIEDEDEEYEELVDNRNDKNILSTLSHEIQHAIQEREGFAKGGNPESLTAKTYNSLIDDLAPIYAEIGSDESLQSKIKAYKKANLELDFSRDDILDQMREAESIKDNDPKLTELWNKLQDISKKYNFVNQAEIEPLFDFRITDIDSSNAREAFWRAKRLFDDRSLFDYLNLAGEVESRNVQARLGMTAEERRRQLLEDTEDVSRNAQTVLFQTAYHGTSADFEQFDLNYGLSGEGSMSFGYGVYVSGSEDIARDYADRQANGGRSVAVYEAQKTYAERKLEETKQELQDFPTLDKWLEENQNSINNLTNRIEERKSNGLDTKLLEGMLKIKTSRNSEQGYNEEKTRIEKKIAGYQKDIDDAVAEIEKAKGNGEKKRHLYTVDIPDTGFIKWDKNVRQATVDKIHDALFNKLAYEPNEDGVLEYKGVENELRRELNDVFNSEYTGQSLYGTVSSYLGGDKNASDFLSKIGYKGIDYPAGTNFGNGNGARNYVIFREKDARIISNMLFQNEINDDILNTAAGFENWVDFMEYVQSVEPEMAPEEAASDWYLNTWEVAHNASPTSAEREAQVIADREEQNQNERKDPVFLDGLFMHEIQKDSNLENFLKLANKVSEITDEEINQLEEDERGYVLNELKKIDTVLSHPTIEMGRKALLKKDELSPTHKQRIINLMRGRTRDYRAVFADITGRTEFSVEQNESLDAELASRARRFNLIRYDSEVENMSPEQKRALEKYVSDKEILKKFREDKVKMDDPDVEHYIGLLEDQLKAAEKSLKDARTEFQDDMEALGSMQMRDILRQYNEFLQLKSEADYRKIPLPAGTKKAQRLGEKAERQNQIGMRQNYNTLAANWDTFKAELEANIKTEERLRAEGRMQEVLERYKKNYDATKSETVQEMMKKAEALLKLEKNHGDVLNELYAVRALKDQRKVLVKRAMRRVNFSSIDYDAAKKIIAIQKVFEPNLFGGVNKWIGTEKTMAREVWTAWVTDEEAQQKILNRLSLKGKTDLIKLLEDTKTEEDFEKWSQKQQKALEKAMPVKDWIKTLNLDAWKEERDGALQLDIKPVTRTRYETQKDGSKKPVQYEGVEMSQEIEEMLIDALGLDMTYAIQNRSFKDWTTAEMIELVKKINKLFKEGRDKLAAKKQAEKLEADRIRNLIDQTIKETGIVINPDDPEDVKKKKQAKIDKILGVSHAFPGTAASRKEKEQTWVDRILHGYHDANVRRVARILDNYSEGTATKLLYFRENDCFNRKQRAVDRRNGKIENVIENNKLDIRKLGKTYKFYDQDFTADEILMIHAAFMNQNDYYMEQLKDNTDLKPEYADRESSYAAIVYGNLITQEERNSFRKMDQEVLEKEKERLDKLHAAELAGNQDEINIYKVREASSVDMNGNLILAGTEALKTLAESRLNGIIFGTQDLKNEFKPLIDAIRADYAEEFDNINRVSIEEFNSPVWREKWYLPLIRQTFGGDTHEQRLKQDLLGHSAGTGKAGTEKGFTKKRVKIGPLNQAPVELGLYKTWADSVERNEHFIAYAGLVREYNRVFDSRDALGMMQNMENRYGHAMTDYIKTYIKEVANPKLMTPAKGLDKVMHIMRGNTAPAYLGWKFSSILKQGIESPAPFMQFVNPVEYMHAALRMTKKEVRESIERKSAFMKSRVFDPMVDLINENVEKSFNKPNYLLKKFQQTGMAGLEWIDWACVAPGWLAVYDKEYRKLQATEQDRFEARVAELTEQNESRYGKFRMTEDQINQQAMEDVAKDIEEAAVLKADDCVRLSQPSNRNVDLAPMFKNNSEAAKAVLQFQTALNVIWQNIRYDIPYAMRNKEYKQVVGMILGYVMAGIMSGVVCSGLLKDDDEPEETAKKLGYAATTQFLDSFPIIGGNLDRMAERAITGEGGPMLSSSLWPTFDKYYNGLNSFIKQDYEKALKNVSQGLALTLGLPLSGIKEAGALFGIGDGDGEIELNPGALAGRRD